MSSNIEHSSRAHSSIGASSSKRWFACPASVKLSEGVEQKSSVHAEEGTAAHEASEYCIENDLDAIYAMGLTFNGFKVTQEMCDAVQVYLDEIKRRIDIDSELLIEERFTLDWIDKEAFGTNDCTIYDGSTGKLTIMDYKHGKGIGVEAVNNTQLLYYALGAMRGFDYVSSVELVIVQPRHDHPDGPIRSWVVSMDEVEEYEEELKKRIAKVREVSSSKDVYKFAASGSHCRFCPAAGFCEVLKGDAYKSAASDFSVVTDEIVLAKPNELSPDQLQRVLDNSTTIETWIKAVKKFAKDEADRGVTIEGYKLVKARANRKWEDESKVVGEFEDLLWDSLYEERKILSPAKLEKLIGKESVGEFTTVPDTGTTLVKNKDKREAITPKAIGDFTKI